MVLDGGKARVKSGTVALIDPAGVRHNEAQMHSPMLDDNEVELYTMKCAVRLATPYVTSRK